MKLKTLLQNGRKYLFDSDYRFLVNSLWCYKDMPDEKYIRRKYKARTGKVLNLENPQTYNEKLQWLKLYDRNPIYTVMADKYLARGIVSERVGEEYLIPLLGVWDTPDEIDFESLPKQFVLKCNHNSGMGMCICRDKSILDIKSVKKELKKGLLQDYYLVGREWPYKDIPRKIICEQYMVDIQEGTETNESDSTLTDYKFFCFNGEPRIMYISKDNAKEPRTDFFDMDFNHLQMQAKDPNSDVLPSKPECFEKMVEMARILSAGVPHLRVDFYYINKQIYVGEMTFFHNSGFSNFKPIEWEKRMGSWIELPNKVL